MYLLALSFNASYMIDSFRYTDTDTDKGLPFSVLK